MRREAGRRRTPEQRHQAAAEDLEAALTERIRQAEQARRSR